MTRFILTLFAAAAIAVSALAQDAAPPRFFIERIEVRNAASRRRRELVIAESLLREGTEYSEDDLRAAAARLSRLPFLLSADFALEKDRSRGRYVLVIHVDRDEAVFLSPRRASHVRRRQPAHGRLRRSIRRPNRRTRRSASAGSSAGAASCTSVDRAPRSAGLHHRLLGVGRRIHAIRPLRHARVRHGEPPAAVRLAGARVVLAAARGRRSADARARR